MRSSLGAGRFELLRELGAGGMGVVYEAHDRQRNLRVALKTLPHPSADGLLRLKTEFRALQDLAHPNLVQLGELHEDQGRWFFTMELVRGSDFLRFVRPDDTPDVARLREALGQICAGLAALHGAGLVHRDLKPSNVLVTDAGRVVILDMGLVKEAPAAAGSTASELVGTVAYMAPEQAASQRVSPPADLYAVGVMLFEALTGQLPLSGAPLELLLRKQREDAPSASAIAGGTPADLDAVARDLLQRDPLARPSAEHVRARLGGTSPRTGDSSGSQPAAFVGRTDELAALRRAFEELARGGPRCVLVEGESGIGKSALVRRFLEEIEAQGGIVLSGRCYERESAPYKGVDDALDALSRILSRMPDAEAILPRDAQLLARTFPVLRRVRALARAPEIVQPGLPGAQDRRSQLLTALREMFQRLGDRHATVLAIDDLQWCDVDGLAVLAELVRMPDPPNVLLVATLRLVPAAIALPAALASAATRLGLGPLSADNASELAERLLGSARASLSSGLVLESGGHPLFLELLARVAGDRERPPKLEDAVRLQVAGLSPHAHTLLELVALAGEPIGRTALARACAAEAELDRSLAELRAAHLVRATAGDALHCYHDRVREAVADGLGAAARQARYRSLAEGFVAVGGADAEQLATCWEGAGDPERAFPCWIEAANRAVERLAFDRAAQLYRAALALRPEPRDVRLRLARALADAGKGGEAAEVFLALVPGARSDELIELRQHAAEQLLRVGLLDRGMSLARQVLGDLGIHLPRSSAVALLGTLLRQVLFLFRRIPRRLVPAEAVAAPLLRACDVSWSLAVVLTTTWTAHGAWLHLRTLGIALRAREPGRLARSLGIVVGLAVAGGRPSRRAVRLLERAQTIAAQASQPYATAYLDYMAGISAHVAGAHRRARDLLGQSAELMRGQCPGTQLEVTTIVAWKLLALMCLGELRERGGSDPEPRIPIG